MRAHLQKGLRDGSHQTLCVWGPVGVGKTRGVLALLESIGLAPLWLDGASMDTLHDLEATLQAALRTGCTTRRRASVLFLDDFESFTEPARALVARLLRRADLAGGAIVTCEQRRDGAMWQLHGLPHVQLFRPGHETCVRWFQRKYGPAVVARESSLLAELRGDLRRIDRTLAWRADLTVDGGLSTDPTGDRAARDTLYTNGFEATRRLLLRTVDWSWWASHAEPWDLALLQYHLLPHACEEPEFLATALEAMSDADTCVPRQFELRASHLRYRAAVAGAAARFASRASVVGALPPPPRSLPRLSEREASLATQCEWWFRTPPRR